MTEQGEFEPQLIPTNHRIDRYHYFNVPIRPNAGKAYVKIMASLPKGLTHLVIAPWLKRGGADLGVLHHLRALTARGCETALITTQSGESPWLSRIPSGIHHVDLGNIAASVSFDDQIKLLTRLIIQIQPAVVHNINSNLMWHATKQFGASLCQTSKLFASLFCDDFSKDGEHTGYARLFLPQTHHFLSCVISDNPQYPQLLIDEYGFESQLFHAAYFPHLARSKPPQTGTKVLWAGRLDNQKRIDILAAVAEQAADIVFDVFGYTLLHTDKKALATLERLPNVNCMGPYDGFDSLPHQEYGAFLYTSSWDGLPNILLEAASSGLPTVAPNVGGVSSFISEQTGYLVDDPESVDGYTEMLRRALTDGTTAGEKVSEAQSLLHTRHSDLTFADSLDKIDYFQRTRG